ncbi:hypothetical protein ACN47E_010003 [Coniothyrium glycines]
MDRQPTSPLLPPTGPPFYTRRQRSNSFPIVEALGCSTPEAQLILAEGRAALRKRKERGKQNRSVHDNRIPTFDPQDHVKYLNSLAALPTPQERPYTTQGWRNHSRIPSDVTDKSTSTIVPQACHGASPTNAPTTSPLGDYSANLAQFIKAQLQSIPAYHAGTNATSPLSPRSCPELSFPSSPPLSPKSPSRGMRRPGDAPKTIIIPSVRPPMRSAFSAWSSTDDETDDETYQLPAFQFGSKEATSKGSTYTPSVLGYYAETNGSFSFPSPPMEDEDEEEESDPDTAKGASFPDQSVLPGSSDMQDDNDYPSSSLSHPPLTTSSAPSNASSFSTSSYFDYKGVAALTLEMTERIRAAVRPPHGQSKILTAISPWEGDALTNVHDVFVESQQRVHVDGLSFDMVRDFVVPGGVPTPG